MATELADFVNDPKRCGVTVVALAEEMPVQEAIELLDTLEERLDRRPDSVIVNGLYPSLAGQSDDDETTALWRHRRQVNELQHARLRERWRGPLIDLPLLATDRGTELVRALSQHLTAALERLEVPDA